MYISRDEHLFANYIWVRQGHQGFDPEPFKMIYDFEILPYGPLEHACTLNSAAHSNHREMARLYQWFIVCSIISQIRETMMQLG